MAQGGSAKVRLAAIEAEIDEHAKEWHALNMSGPQPFYRFNNDEFNHHVHLLALEKILKEKLNLTDTEVHCYIASTFLEESKTFLVKVKEHRSEEIRKQIAIPKPDIIV